MKALNAMLAGLMLTATLFAIDAHAVAGTTTVTKSKRQYDGSGKLVRVVKVVWSGDSSGGAVTSATITGVHGYLMKVVTDPGSTAPTDNYDITLKDTADGVTDCMNAAGVDRDTANTEVAYPLGASGTVPAWCQPDTYTFAIAGNSVNSANGTVWMYFIDAL